MVKNLGYGSFSVQEFTKSQIDFMEERYKEHINNLPNLYNNGETEKFLDSYKKLNEFEKKDLLEAILDLDIVNNEIDDYIQENDTELLEEVGRDKIEKEKLIETKKDLFNEYINGDLEKFEELYNNLTKHQQNEFLYDLVNTLPNKEIDDWLRTEDKNFKLIVELDLEHVNHYFVELAGLAYNVEKDNQVRFEEFRDFYYSIPTRVRNEIVFSRGYLTMMGNWDERCTGLIANYLKINKLNKIIHANEDDFLEYYPRYRDVCENSDFAKKLKSDQDLKVEEKYEIYDDNRLKVFAISLRQESFEKTRDLCNEIINQNSFKGEYMEFVKALYHNIGVVHAINVMSRPHNYIDNEELENFDPNKCFIDALKEVKDEYKPMTNQILEEVFRMKYKINLGKVSLTRV
jgi:hypothetical protein